ncbi:hypothetical protein FB645_002868 [Coemansia sp. IMI 203386]|nr:hypothetical protein FB645_002868 [Coemansia sp. IMI 203386]
MDYLQSRKQHIETAFKAVRIPNKTTGTTVATTLLVAFVVGLVIYRLYFTPLHKIPGSFLCKISGLHYQVNAILGRFGQLSIDDYYKYGNIYVLGPNIVAICDPADCRTILKSHRFPKGPIYDDVAIHGETLFTTRSPEVSNTRRKQIGPAFTHSSLNAMEPVLIECGINSIRNKWDELISQSSDKTCAEINYFSHFSLATFDIVGTLSYGQRFQTLKNSQSQITRWIFDYNKLTMINVILKVVERLPLNLVFRKLIKSKDDFVAYGDAIVQNRRHQLISGELSEKPKDILQALLDSEDPESKTKMTPKEISAETIELFLAGSDSTSLTLTWAMHYLLLYPDVYRKAVDEVRGNFPYSHTITYNEGKTRLPYVEACIYEALRIHAVSGTPLPRVVPKGGVTLQGHFLPEGTFIGVNIAGANHHKETWKEPRKFMPERFIDNEKAKQNVMSFSSGVRVCPGRNLAQYEMLTLLSNILKDYDLELPKDALFRPEKKDEYGNPIAMPCIQNLLVGPLYPARDCRVSIRRTEKY